MRALLVLTMLLGLTLGAAAPVAAQENEDAPTIRTTTTLLEQAPAGAGSIVGPKPGEGVAPNDAGDRGGAAQLATLAAIVIALGSITFFIRRDITKKKAAATTAEPVEA